MLDATLAADTEGDTVRFTLTVENTGTDAETLSFRDSQRAEFVARSGETEVWRWSEGQLFAQMLGSETVEPGATVTYEAEWEVASGGTYTVVGTVVADDCDVSAEATVSV
ncbi:conserved repeat domain-containing protein [Halogranum gelatinilyticum]|uniref:Conserved repeat domain-containing protein n=1 Tax=Halogranum gelatinilyticum TaxID=660521 RepID=A0A1H0A7D8_9EURY|nr:BsuPI-related putative proteinase inhibitor [Halogranum gelatinilyticum]SDN29114.1 conserved repeat domain-containing protein [Halogranum gelatinilyticum]